MNKTSNIPPPLVFSPSQVWEGNDGSWSTFYIRVGIPEQNFRVLISTAGNEVIVPLPEGCEDEISNCGNLRGVAPFQNKQSTGFQVNMSSTWESLGLYNLLLESRLYGEDNAGLYGFDTVGLQIQNSGGPSLNKQVIAGIATKDFFLGLLGLDPRPSNFTGYSDPQPSFLSSLKSNSIIPSLSYSYTAGASYRYRKVLASLIFGGYDKSRFSPSNLEFPFSADDGRYLTVCLQNIVISNTFQGTIAPLTSGFLSVIDSTIPEIWLPIEVCNIFEAALGLTYDASTERYLINNTIRVQLITKAPVFTFKLGLEVFGGNSTNINLPYAAFDLAAQYPIYPNTTYYFPIRRAANDSQYVISRTFLQEAYIITDFERKTFTVNQAIFSDPLPDSYIVPILPPSVDQTEAGKKTALSTTGIIGLVIGSIVIVLLIAAFIFVRRHILQRRASIRSNMHPINPAGRSLHEVKNTERSELSGESQKFEMCPSTGMLEAAASYSVNELENNSPLVELEGSEHLPRSCDLAAYSIRSPADSTDREETNARFRADLGVSNNGQLQR